MKITLVLLFAAFLTGCDAHNSSCSEPDKEPGMLFGKRSKENHVISSPLQGVLMQNGKPLPNTKITRRLWWNGNDEGLLEEFVTDEQGRFSLPVHEEQLSLGILNQFVAKAELEAELKNGFHRFWYNSKLMPELYSETDGALSELICDMDFEEVPVYLGESVVPNIMTKCRWKNMPDV